MIYKDNYKNLAKFYDGFLGGNYKKYGDIINIISDKYIKDFKNIKILDIGCGTGGILNYMKYSTFVDGIDISEKMIDIAKKKFPKNKFYEMSFIDLTLSEKYNMIFSIFDTLNHVKSQEELNNIIATSSNLLNKGGVLFFDINTLFKFKSFKSDIFQVIKEKNEILTINREFEFPNSGKWNIEILSELEGYKGYYCKTKSAVKEIAFELDNLNEELNSHFSEVYIFDLDKFEINLDITINSISKCPDVSRLGFLCIK